ncbi:hypothetical protein [Collimonas sp.]|jgi:hypothetical protein|uniref:hypothetical protein n=1 Tax=Collimonas sp. TaxID=1963772 RepID=UPI002CE4705A|nr:hypothetical protein [Collimonas sp.]HWW99802.1 hypothetical protein [Collimonas sp.]
MKIEFKQVLLYAITPALIAGFFSIAPKLYEVIAEPRAVLQYALVAGPQIAIDGVQEQVISLRVSNAGKKTLTAIRAELSVPGGSLAAASIENNSGLTIESKKYDDRIVITIPKALEGEAFSIAALLKSSRPRIEPKFVLRSEEVLGKADEPATSPLKDIRTALFSALGAAISVLMMALAALLKLKPAVQSSRRNTILYIALATKVDTLIQTVRAEGEEITYMDFSDMLFALGKSADESSKLAAIASLKCLLEINGISDISRIIVKRNLEALLGKPIENGAHDPVISTRDVIKFRDRVDLVFAGQSSN